MKILAVYATKTMTCEKCLCELEKCLPQGEITRANITNGSCAYDLKDFDFVLIGSSIRMGRINRRVKNYIKDHMNELSGTNYALFLCLGFVDLFDEYARKNFPGKVMDDARAVACFGGEMDLSRQKGIDKLIIKIVRDDIMGGGNNGQPREDISLPTINENNISQLAEIIKQSV